MTILRLLKRMRRQLNGKRILITGAASGIGRAIAFEAAQTGMRLILADIDQAPLETAATDLRRSGAEAIAVPADLTSSEDREAVLLAADKSFGGLDILVNNAGTGAYGYFMDQSPTIMRQIMDVNFFACAENCRLAIPLLTRGDQPLIVNISSMFGCRGIPGWSTYCASKFALRGFSEAVRPELGRLSIDLMLVLPGVVDTNFGRNLLAGSEQISDNLVNGLPPNRVAQRILAGIRANRSELIIGGDATRLVWANRLFPRLVDFRLRRYAGQQSAWREEEPHQ